jgi:LPS sulfotransferase NodH
MDAPTHRKPLPYRLVDRIGSTLRALGVPIAQLDERSLLAAARRKTGLSDYGDPGFREGLSELLQSARQDAELHFIGRLAMQGLVLTALTNRLQLEQARNSDPGLATRPLRPPIIVMGLPRSGTTLLHRLLAEDPEGRAVPAWELLRPVRPRGRDRRRAQAARQMRIIHDVAPWADRIHETHPDAPEECMLLMTSSFESILFWAVAPVYGYLDWLLRQDPTRAYSEYRTQLQILTQAVPHQRLVLKSPSHTAHLAALCETVPEARIIQCHRDPVQAVVSMNSLFRAAHGILSDHVDLHRMAQANVELLAATSERNLRDREHCADRVHDVDYRELVAHPMDVVRAVYERFDLPWTDTLAGQLQRYVDDHPKGKHGAHRYHAEDFGLSEPELADRFGAYRKQFGLA